MNKKLKKDFINFKHLERLFTSQEYFVWNINVQNAIDEFVLEEKNEESSFWEIFSDFELEELEDYKFVEIIKNGYDHVNNLFIDYVKKMSQDQNKNSVVVNEKSNQIAFEKTMRLIDDDSVDWIINPIFIYEDLICKPALYMKDSKKLFSLIHASKSKLKHYIRAYFEYNVLLKLDLPINEYLFFLYDKEKDYKKEKDLSFTFSKYCWTQKSGPTKQTKSTIEEHAKDTIIEKLKSGKIKTKTKRVNGQKEEILEISLYLNDFDNFIEQIRDVKQLKAPKNVSEKDITSWGTNPNFNELFNFEEFNLKKVSGSLLKKNELLDLFYGRKNLDDFARDKKSLNYLLKNKHIYDKEEINHYISRIESSKVVWYDFEGFSMPYAIIAHIKPYQQIVFQVSIIRTDNEKISFTNNIVLDPKNIKIEDFIDIVNQIYWDEANYYVVFNKSYEISKLKEMIILIEKSSLIDEIKIRDLKKKILDIEEKTIDLLELFKITQSKDKIPPIFIPDLLGFSSIKKIEKYINENKLDLEVMIQPYSELEVQNGLMAMNKAIQRHLNSIGDKEWEKETKNLATYCENDVKAMIMVYFFIKKIAKNLT